VPEILGLLDEQLRSLSLTRRLLLLHTQVGRGLRRDVA
jgi:hypothetical protein